jgi:hypothetical protein
MATTTRLRDFLGRPLVNPSPGVTDPVMDFLGRNIPAGNVDSFGRSLIATTRVNSTAYSPGAFVQFASGKLYVVTAGGTSAASAPSDTSIGYGQPLADGTVTLRRVF